MNIAKALNKYPATCLVCSCHECCVDSWQVNVGWGRSSEALQKLKMMGLCNKTKFISVLNSTDLTFWCHFYLYLILLLDSRKLIITDFIHSNTAG